MRSTLPNTSEFSQLPNGTTPPPNPLLGQEYYDTVLQIVRVWSGTAWHSLAKIENPILTGNLSNVVWTGTTAPSTNAFARWRASVQNGVVHCYFTLGGDVAGTGLTQVAFDLPTDLPAPALDAFITDNNQYLQAPTAGRGYTAKTATAGNQAFVGLRRSTGSASGFQVLFNYSSQNTLYVAGNLTYLA
jgi:hypothetical protein